MRAGFLFLCLTLTSCLFVAAGCSRTKKLSPIAELLAKGDALLLAEDYKGADTAYKTALSHQPENPRTLSRLGRLAYRQGRTVTAYLLIQGTLDKLPEDPDILLIYGLASHALSRTTDARTAAKKVLERQPANEEALILLVETGITSRDSAEARRIIEQAQAKQPDAAPFHVAFGMLHMLQGEDQQAEKEFRRALELDPKSAAAHSQLGSLLLRQGQQDKGTAALKQACELSPLRSPRRIKYIERLVQTGAVDEARRELGLITAQAPDYVPAWTQTMKLAFQLGQYDESAAAADKVIDADRANYDAWMQRVALKLQRGDLEGVITDLQKVEGFYNKSPEVKYQLALVLLQKGELFAAEQHLQQALRMAPNYDEAILLQADIDLRKGNTSAASVNLRQYLKRRPKNTQAQILLAQVHRADGESKQALDVLQALAEAFPKHPDAPYLVGLTLLELDRREEARGSFEHALSLSEKYWPALEMLIELDLTEKRAAAATQRIERLLQKYPDVVPLWLLRAKIRVALNDSAGAEADLTKAIEMDPKTSYPYLLLSRIYLNADRLQESLDKLTALAAQKPTANTWMQVGMLQGMLRDFDAARASYEKALAIDAKFGPALNNLALLHVEHLGKVEQAEALIKRAREASPQDPLITDTAGWILVRKGQHENALRLLQTASERLPGDPEVLYHLGMAQYYLGQDEPARLAFTSVLAATTDSRVKQDAAARLAILRIDPAKATPAMKLQLEAATAKDPNDPIAFIRLAAIEARDGRLPEAAALYETALKVNPRSAGAMLALVELYFGPLQKPDRARDLAKLLRDSAPADGLVAWKLGRLIFAAGDFAWANSLLQDAARSLPDQADLLLDVARSQYSVGRVAETAAALEKIPALPAPPAIRAEVARMADMLAAASQPAVDGGRLAEARKILADAPSYVPALVLTAMAFEQQKQPTQAQQAYEQILTVYPLFGPAMRQLAILAGEQFGDDAKAEEWSRKALKVLPEDPDANYQLGVVSYRRGEYAEAARFLNQSLRKRDGHAIAYFFLGMSYFQLKNGSECGIALQRALQLKLPPQEATEATRVLDLLARRRGNL